MRTVFLTALELASSIPGIKLVDEDFGQLDGFDTKPSVPPGTILISVGINRIAEISAKRQNCFGDVTLRLYPDMPIKQETSSLAPEAARARSLAYYDLVEAIYKKFQGYYTDEVNEFKRVSCRKETREDITVVRTIFSTSWTDISAEQDDEQTGDDDDQV